MPRALLACLALALWGAAACGGSQRPDLTATLTDEITRSYPLTATGEIVLTNTSGGAIEVEATDGSTVELRAVRKVEGATEQMAREVLPRITLKETITPDKVIVETESLRGIVVGVSFEVTYHARAPRSATLRVRTRNGPATIAGFAGNVAVTTTNGPITATGLGGGVEARNTNGPTRIELASFGQNLVDIRSTNGPVVLTIPAVANATLLATATNGRIDLDGLPFEPMGEQRPRRVRGRINAGGSPIEIVTTNGNIRVGPPGAHGAHGAPGAPGVIDAGPPTPAKPE